MQEWITNTMTSLGYVGIGLLMFLENLFPPIPSELIMPLAGFTIAQKQMAFFPAILAGVIGTMLGALPWYYVGKLVGEENLKRLADKYGRWISISSRDIEKADNWFDRHGEKAVFFCRLVPGVRTLISLPAGMSGMHLVPFLIYSTVGTTLWVGLLTYTGYILGEKYELVDEYLGPVSKIVFVGLVVAFVVWIVRKRQKAKRKNL
ncbi:DedA family protein [Planktothrix sp. FACHB-1355]|uniref:DedA family protein n=2 Tax=Oscillatoriophycideae TaxID=1301283 RepID=A0A926VE16_9CYAN|nr:MULTISPECIES: DedA family protein [Oscillatoriales]MBD2182191.1 DedA family protein [Aerosakkonema funiforme FACHB-1375]MBD3561784.1 DedA family protein [Planktothrix sp. FACHB-1355]